jgi:hypothetical protein
MLPLSPIYVLTYALLKGIKFIYFKPNYFIVVT